MKLRAARVLRGLTQGDLGKRIDRSQTWVCELEHGLIEPSDLDVALVCRVLGVQPEDIFPLVNAAEEGESLLTAGGEIEKPP